MAAQGLPFITLGRSLTDAGQPWYDLDFEGIAREGIGRLVAKGHRRIAVVAPHDEINLGYVLTERYRAELARHGIGFDPALVLRALPNEAGGYAAARRLLDLPERPTAVLLVNETMPVGLYRGLAEAGVRPGRDIAVIGRDSPNTRFLSPTLTCFRTSLRDLGAALAESLLATMPPYRDLYPQGIVRKLWPMVLTEGESDEAEPAPGRLAS